MNSNERANELTQHIENENVRKRVNRSLAALFADLEHIGSYAEDEDLSEQSWKDDGSDGIPVISPSEMDKRESDRIEALKAAQFFPPSAIEVNTDEDINARGKFGYTKLHDAAVERDLDKVIELLEAGIDPTIKDNSGSTAYQKAINRGYDDVADLIRPYMPSEFWNGDAEDEVESATDAEVEQEST